MKHRKQYLNLQPDLAEVKGGTFQMGSHEGDPDERPVHQVTLSDFAIGKYLVTQGEFCLFLKEKDYDPMKPGGYHPSSEMFEEQFQASSLDASGRPFDKNWLPIRFVSFRDIVNFCNWANKKWGYTPAYTKVIHNPSSGYDIEIHLDPQANGFRLPTEAEWEYAARGGLNQLHPMPVILKKPNQLGPYDMSGNLLEFCWDIYDENYYSDCLKAGTVENPLGPNGTRSNDGRYQVYRGGGQNDWASGCHVAKRYKSVEERHEDWASNIGFRLARFLCL